MGGTVLGSGERGVGIGGVTQDEKKMRAIRSSVTREIVDMTEGKCCFGSICLFIGRAYQKFN
jgi:hypothetical protein